MSDREVMPIVVSPIVTGWGVGEGGRGWRDKSADVCRAHVVGWLGILPHGANRTDVATRQDVNKINAPKASMRREIVPTLA
jgi:hypothetical protein